MAVPSASRNGCGPWGRALDRLVTGVALAGGGVLVMLVLVTVASVTGRSLFSAPVPGDYELVEIGCAIAVSAFLPYCHRTRGNVAVELLSLGAHPRLDAGLRLFGDGLYAVLAAVMTWRLALGGLEIRTFQETTMVLRLPVWWAYGPVTLCFALLTLSCLHTLAVGLKSRSGGHGRGMGGS